MRNTKRTEIITNGMSKREIVWNLENEFERFPLPLCLDPREEQRELYRRHLKIERIVDRLYSLYKLTESD